MDSGTLLIVGLVLGPVVFALMEATKLLVKTKLGAELKSGVKLKVTLIAAGFIGTVAALASGQVDVVPLIAEVRGLFTDTPDAWALFGAVKDVAGSILAAVGSVVAVSQAVYAMLRSRLKEVGWLAA